MYRLTFVGTFLGQYFPGEDAEAVDVGSFMQPDRVVLESFRWDVSDCALKPDVNTVSSVR